MMGEWSPQLLIDDRNRVCIAKFDAVIGSAPVSDK